MLTLFANLSSRPVLNVIIKKGLFSRTRMFVKTKGIKRQVLLADNANNIFERNLNSFLKKQPQKLGFKHKATNFALMIAAQ